MTMKGCDRALEKYQKGEGNKRRDDAIAGASVMSLSGFTPNRISCLLPRLPTRVLENSTIPSSSPSARITPMGYLSRDACLQHARLSGKGVFQNAALAFSNQLHLFSSRTMFLLFLLFTDKKPRNRTKCVEIFGSSKSDFVKRRLLLIAHIHVNSSGLSRPARRILIFSNFENLTAFVSFSHSENRRGCNTVVAI